MPSFDAISGAPISAMVEAAPTEIVGLGSISITTTFSDIGTNQDSNAALEPFHVAVSFSDLATDFQFVDIPIRIDVVPTPARRGDEAPQHG